MEGIDEMEPKKEAVTLQEKILKTMKTHMKENPNDYINPNFMQSVTRQIYVYFELEDDELDDLILDMFGR